MPSTRSRPMRWHDLSFPAIGTTWTLRTERPLLDGERGAVAGRIDEFDRIWSRFRTDSLVTAAREPGTHDFPAEATALMSFYRRLYELTDGRMTPLVGAALEHLGYDAAYRRTARPGAVTVPRWDDAIAWNGRQLTTIAPVVIDVGAAGKGYLVDLVSELLLGFGQSSFVVDASGDLRHAGPAPIRVGLEHPADPTKVIGVVELAGAALCGSATNRRSWGHGLHHVLDAHTGTSTRDVVATWVIADTALHADGLATALFLTDPEVLEEHFDFRWVRVLASGVVQRSANFEGALFA